ncbi:hypothetical protein [Bradyrhizobium sp. CCBAU 11361]|uniref:hypothetical protein n=1 Tax=Bradyrhizobium sp. CCBAU 11361 TaxID=1630812 RepID=UPI0023048523|nr:hypothetical protein [Bradyrhizobium sp. CCBAU 11361]MDA9488860.1 hypothetical protein [Bradyrhizobium sp. CCBAU 11361]
MSEHSKESETPLYDRALLLHGSKRNELLTLEEVRRYGSDSFADPDFLRLYGMTPARWYARGVRLLGRTAVECTRDAVADRIGQDVATVAASLPAPGRWVVVDPFAGSCNTLYWILRHVLQSRGIAFEFDPQVFRLTKQNLALLDRTIDLKSGDYGIMLGQVDIAPDETLIVFVAPPWGTALDETEGLDLRRTEPPITEIIAKVGDVFPTKRTLFAVQVYEKLNKESLAELQGKLDWSDLKIYDFNAAGRNHGVLLGTRGWTP